MMNKLDKFSLVEMEGDGTKSSSVKNNQIISMFNSLQCHLMTLQSTMVSLQMNQNIIQTSVDSVTKKLSKMNTKLNSIQSCLGFPDMVDVPSINNDTTDLTDVENQKKRKKKNKKKCEDLSEGKESTKSGNSKKSKSENIDSSFNMSSTLNTLQNDQKEWKEIGTELNLVNDETEVCEEIPEEIPEESLNVKMKDVHKKKRKRRRKRRNVPEVAVPKTPSPPPTYIKMNLPTSQRPNNIKIKFESESENEEMPGETRIIATDDLSSNIQGCQTVFLPLPPSQDSPNLVASFSNKFKHKGLQVGDVLRQIRSEMKVNGKDLNNSNNEVNEQNLSFKIEIQNTVMSDECDELSKDVEIDKCDTEMFEVIPIKNYNTFPDLHGPPRTGDKIAYKILELSDSYCPEVSAYKEAAVMSYNNSTNVIELHLSTPVKSKDEPGKFDLPDNEDEENKDVEYKIQLNWTELIEPKLII